MNNSNERFSSDKVGKIHTELEEVLKHGLHRSNQVVIFPTLENKTINYDGIFFSKKKNDILVLVLVYHFSDFFGIFSEYVRYEIEQYLYHNLLAPAGCQSRGQTNLFRDTVESQLRTSSNFLVDQ